MLKNQANHHHQHRPESPIAVKPAVKSAAIKPAASTTTATVPSINCRKHKFKQQTIHTSVVAQNNVVLLVRLAHIYFAAGDYLKFTEKIMQALSTPNLRIMRPYLYEQMGLGLLLLNKEPLLARLYFTNACFTFRQFNAPNTKYYNTSIIKYLFFISFTNMLCENFERASHYYELMLKFSPFFSSRDVTKSQAILINVLGAHIYYKIRKIDRATVAYNTALCLLDSKKLMTRQEVVAELSCQDFFSFFLFFKKF